MAAYWIVRGSAVKDQSALKRYGEMWTPIAKRYSARVIAGKGDFETPEGDHYPRVLIVEFPSYERARACYNDPEYARAMEYAHRAYDRELTIVEGID